MPLKTKLGGKGSKVVAWPCVADSTPDEEGGPIARGGFNYQDEIAVSFFIDMLGQVELLKVHCETHDDIVLIWKTDSPKLTAEYIQVKAGEEDKLWSLADLCERKKAKVGSSLFKKPWERTNTTKTRVFAS